MPVPSRRRLPDLRISASLHACPHSGDTRSRLRGCPLCACASGRVPGAAAKASEGSVGAPCRGPARGLCRRPERGIRTPPGPGSCETRQSVPHWAKRRAETCRPACRPEADRAERVTEGQVNCWSVSCPNALPTRPRLKAWPRRRDDGRTNRSRQCASVRSLRLNGAPTGGAAATGNRLVAFAMIWHARRSSPLTPPRRRSGSPVSRPRSACRSAAVGRGPRQVPSRRWR